MSGIDARLWHPWLPINRVLRVMLHTRWSAEAWAQVRVKFRKALALRSQIRRAVVQLKCVAQSQDAGQINATHAINSAAIRMIPPIPAIRRPAVSLLARRTATIPHTAITANTAMATRARITRGGKFTTYLGRKITRERTSSNRATAEEGNRRCDSDEGPHARRALLAHLG
jgi:hypothetical protein